MSKLIFVILMAVLLPFAAAAQNKEYRGQGYVFVAPGTASEIGATLHIGGGGEGLIYKGLGVGGEVGSAISARPRTSAEAAAAASYRLMSPITSGARANRANSFPS